jgi:hypothetical protein
LAQRGAREQALAVEEDRLDHLDHRGGWGVERRPAAQQLDHLGPAVPGALHDLLEPLRGEQPADGASGDLRAGQHRHHRVAVAAENQGADIGGRDAELAR